jgi:hypothetical protein
MVKMAAFAPTPKARVTIRRKRESWTLDQHAGAEAEIPKQSLHAAIMGMGKEQTETLREATPG